MKRIILLFLQKPNNKTIAVLKEHTDALETLFT